jgi:hypothetical protein
MRVPKISVERVYVMLRSGQVPGSKFFLEIGYRDPNFRRFPQSLQINTGIVVLIRSRSFSSAYSVIHHALIILPFDAIVNDRFLLRTL